GCEDGAVLLSEGRYVLLLDGADPAPALSKPRSQSEKELAQCFFLQVTSQRAGWKMPIFLILCLLQGESQTAQLQSLYTQTRAFQAADMPGGHLSGIQHLHRSLGICMALDRGSGQIWVRGNEGGLQSGRQGGVQGLPSPFPCSFSSLPRQLALGRPVGSQQQMGGEQEPGSSYLMGWLRTLWPGRALELAPPLVDAFVAPSRAHLLPVPQVLLWPLHTEDPVSGGCGMALSPLGPPSGPRKHARFSHPFAGGRSDPSQAPPLLSLLLSQAFCASSDQVKLQCRPHSPIPD
ncbi:hypothetical protein J1605_018100, partial [Eschrichtius robustus]